MTENDGESYLVQSMNEGPHEQWSYRSANRQAGAFRAASVEGLLATPPKISLSEWPNLDWEACTNLPKYAAISHVWKASAKVEWMSLMVDRPLNILTKESAPHKISWYGLVQAATAAQYLKCPYLWLDLLCIDQNPNDDDKERQIKNMANIYKNATAVLVMLGGVQAVQSYWDCSAWVLRAWNLQEATLCIETYALVTSPSKDHWAMDEHEVDGVELSYNEFTLVNDEISIVRLLDLLERSTSQSRYNSRSDEGVYFLDIDQG